ncbi:MAG: DUF3489 domain-containing protein [Bryobacteraceae bacterium]|nr:DUF3489 domain-containing protein [Bryobacteraceae bacterium]
MRGPTTRKDHLQDEKQDNQHGHRSRRRCATKRAQHVEEASREKDCVPEEERARGQHGREGAAHQGDRHGSERPAQEEALQAESRATLGKLTKKGVILELLRRESGATLAELADATGWKPNSILGFLSGNLRKKLGLVV